MLFLAGCQSIDPVIKVDRRRSHPDIPIKYKGVNVSSHYLTMRDGVKLAFDLYLPEGLEEGAKIPAILMQTRYARAFEYRWPFSCFLSGRHDETIEYFVRRGYAWMYVDLRGSGSSSGFRPCPYSPEEIKDGYEIADWIISQPWSNGSIGAYGNSYEGGSAILLLTNNHDAVKAVIACYAPFDFYEDVIFPGGIQLNWFIDTWSSLCRALDNDRIEEFVGLIGKIISPDGIKAVDSDKDGSMKEANVAEHTANTQLTDHTTNLKYRDDRSSKFPNHTIDSISPHTHLDELNRSDAAIYIATGWYDPFVCSSIKYFLFLENPEMKLTIGPWDHGGWNDINTDGEGDRGSFDKNAEMLRFFEYHLKGADTGINNEAPVSFVTLVEDKWKYSDTWPPPGIEKVLHYLDEHNSLVLNAPESSSGFDIYEVDYTAGTGNSSRWNSLINWKKKRIYYPDRYYADKKLLCYTTAPLKEDTEVTGHPKVTLYVSSTAEDGSFFVYLEDVDPQGRVTYVTEGMLRMLHSRKSDNIYPCTSLIPCRTYKKEDALLLEPGEITVLVFSLFPTSYLFKKGHSIRISIAGADKDHFAFIPDEPPEVRIYRNSSYPSCIALPIKKMSSN
jgi:putative CocE/NonD family hydrolase